MGTRTVYVKNEALWEAAKALAGTGGLSGFVEEALERLITAKREELAGFQRIYVPVEPSDTDPSGGQEILGFDGKLLDDSGTLSVYLTKAGKLIVTDNSCDAEGSIFGYRDYSNIAELRDDRAIGLLEKDAQRRLLDMIREALPQPVFTTWID